jgi:glycosyltransferase involved in cell wall biosynthesis
MRDRGPLAERCREAEIDVLDGLMPRRRGPGVVRRFGWLAAERQFDTLFVIECFYINTLLAYWAARRRWDLRTFAIVHNWPSRRQFSHPILHLPRVFLMDRIFDRIVFIAERQRRHYAESLGIRFARTTVISSGIDVDQFAPGMAERDPLQRDPADRHVRVGIVGSLQPRKGHEYFLQAAAEVLRRQSDVQFLVIGDGPRRGELRQMAHDLKIEDNVHFLGVQTDLAELLRAIDVLILASHEAAGGHAETVPLVLLEAGATALPVVATDVGAISDIVVDGRTGYLVPQRDWRALAEKIDLLLSDPQKRREMGSIARERVFAKFDARRMCRRFEQMFLTGQ